MELILSYLIFNNNNKNEIYFVNSNVKLSFALK